MTLSMPICSMSETASGSSMKHPEDVGMPHSEAASKTGSLYRPRSWCSDGRPSGAGFALNDTAFAPRSAQRRISVAASRRVLQRDGDERD